MIANNENHYQKKSFYYLATMNTLLIKRCNAVQAIPLQKVLLLLFLDP